MAPATARKARKAKAARIFLVDDHPIVLFGFRELIEEEKSLEVCGQAETAADALEKIAELRPDLVVIDISLGDANGIDLVKKVRALDSSIRVLIASMHDESLYAERALRAGALGYVNKSEATAELVGAIHSVLQGDIHLSPKAIGSVIGYHFDRRGLREGTREGSPAPIRGLSDRELEIFELVGRGLTARQIAENLGLSVKTIDTFRAHIKRKLGLKNNAELSFHAVRWVLEES